MKTNNPLAAELVHLLNRMNDSAGLTREDLDRITVISREMNRLNPAFEIIEFEEDK